jgi:hypothetical protein
MLLGRKVHGAGDHIRYVIDYSNWLEEGESLSDGDVVLAPEFTATVTDVIVGTAAATPSNCLVFMLSGGSANEVFTLNVQATNSRAEVKNDTIDFTVVAP